MIVIKQSVHRQSLATNSNKESACFMSSKLKVSGSFYGDNAEVTRSNLLWFNTTSSIYRYNTADTWLNLLVKHYWLLASSSGITLQAPGLIRW